MRVTAPVLVLRAEYIVDIEDVVKVIVIKSFVVYRLARLREHPARIVRRFVAELRITQPERVDEARGQLLEWLQEVG